MVYVCTTLCNHISSVVPIAIFTMKYLNKSLLGSNLIWTRALLIAHAYFSYIVLEAFDRKVNILWAYSGYFWNDGLIDWWSLIHQDNDARDVIKTIAIVDLMLDFLHRVTITLLPLARHCLREVITKAGDYWRDLCYVYWFDEAWFSRAHPHDVTSPISPPEKLFAYVLPKYKLF